MLDRDFSLKTGARFTKNTMNLDASDYISREIGNSGVYYKDLLEMTSPPTI